MGCACNHEIKHNAEKAVDPTGTKVLRDRYSAACYKRFRKLKGLIRKTIIDNNALRMIDRRPSLLSNAQPASDFEFTQDYKKVDAFMAWLQQAEDDEILEVIERDGQRVTDRNEWQNKYIKQAYKKGYEDATDELRKQGIDIPERQSLTASLSAPMHSDALGMMYTRNFQELQGITRTMDQQISRVLTNGLAEGKGAYAVARDINDRVSKIGVTRSRVLARTEIIRSYNESALNRFESMGVDNVTVQAEWSIADSDACPRCKGLQGNIYSISEARGLIPLHPRCRCSWLPVNP